MIAVSTPNHPLRLAGLLAASVAFFAIVSAAAYVSIWMIDDQRNGGSVSEVAGVSALPKQSDFNLPSGVLALQHITDEAQFEQTAGYKAFVPSGDALPSMTKSDAVLSLTFPDAAGARVGRVGFSARDGDVDGIAGPTVVLLEAPLSADAHPDGLLKRITLGSGRALVANISCRGLVVDVQFYFGPEPKEGEPFVTPYMTSVAQKSLDAIVRECAS